MWCPIGTLYRFEYFGDPSLPQMMGHFARHLKEISKCHTMHGGNIALWIFVPTNINREEFKNALWHKLGLHGKEVAIMETMMLKMPLMRDSAHIKSNI